MGGSARKRSALVTGAAGMLGAEFCRRLAPEWRVVALDRRPAVGWADDAFEADITDEFGVKRVLERSRPDLVVHCAALVDVDGAEEDFAAGARAVNALGTRNVARHTPSVATLVYISTDSVFDGKGAPYVETDLPSPLNAYAKTKLEGEWFARQEAERALVVRTNFFGRHHDGTSSFAEWIMASLSSGSPIRMAEDWWYTPVYSGHLVDAVLAMVREGLTGLYHVAGSRRCSKLEFALALADAFGFDRSLIEPVRFGQLSFRAPRPQDMSLDCSKVQRDAGIRLPGYDEGVRRLREAWEAR